ncbi:MAG: hypothetical protein ABIS14_04915 [Sphingomonas sp.]
MVRSIGDMKRLWLIGICLALDFVPGSAMAGRSAVTQTSAPAALVLRQAFDAMGGRGRLVALRSLKLELQAVSYRIDDSERADGSPWLNVSSGIEYRDEEAGRSRLTVDVNSAQWSTKTDVIDDGHVAVSGTSGQFGTFWNARPSLGERVALSPERILLAAEASDDLHREPDVTLFGTSHRVLAFTWRSFPVHLFIDTTSHLLQRMETTRSWAPDQLSAMLGDITWRTDYLFYRHEPDGLTYPWQQNTFRDGAPYQTLVVHGLQENPLSVDDRFTPTAEGRDAVAKLRVIPYDDAPIAIPATGDAVTLVAPGVWVIAGNWNVLVVRQSDGLVVIEAPQSSGYSEKVLALLAQRFPGKKVKAVISTTDSLWHYAGLRSYVARGIPIYALDLSVPRLRAFFERPRRFVPDELARRPRIPLLRPVGGRTLIGTGAQRIELYPIGGSGDARMVMAYLPGLKLLYGSSNDYNKVLDRDTFNFFELVRKVDELHLSVADYVAIHTDKMPWSDVRAIALEKRPIGSN